MNKNLTKWHKATQDLVEDFIVTYFVDEEISREELEVYWVADEIGGVLVVGDYFFDMYAITTAIRVSCPTEKLFEWYNYTIDHENNISLDYYSRMSNIK